MHCGKLNEDDLVFGDLKVDFFEPISFLIKPPMKVFIVNTSMIRAKSQLCSSISSDNSVAYWFA